MAGRLKDKVCIITGTGSGMGRAAALLFCEEGAKVVGSDINADNAQATLRDAQKAGGQMVSLQPADLTKQERCDALVDLALKTHGGIDVVYNNAATAYFGWMDKFTYEEFARTIEGELLIVFRFCKNSTRIYLARGGGSIINVGSIAGEAGVMGVYSASKFGMRGLSDSVRREVRADGVRVTLIEPGFVRTPMNAAMGDGLPGPEVVADAIVDAVDHPRRVRIVPKRYLLPRAIARAFPGLLDAVFGHPRIQARLNRDARADRARDPR